MEGLALATTSLRTRADFDDYVAAFNVDDFSSYCAYYAEDIFVSASSTYNPDSSTHMCFYQDEHPIASGENAGRLPEVDQTHAYYGHRDFEPYESGF